MSNVVLRAFNNETFNQKLNVSASLKNNFFNPPNLILQHLPVKEAVGKVENIGLRNGHITDALTSFDNRDKL